MTSYDALLNKVAERCLMPAQSTLEPDQCWTSARRFAWVSTRC